MRGSDDIGIRRSEEEEGPGKPTPLRADFAAKLALALCLPPMGAVNDRVSTSYTEPKDQELRGARMSPDAQYKHR